MQEHIRRAHPEYYIPKLPATEESFQLMVNTPPSARPPQLPPPPPLGNPNADSLSFNGDTGQLGAPFGHERDVQQMEYSSPALLRNLDDVYPVKTAAIALAQLHSTRPDADWDSEAVWDSCGGFI